MGLVTGIGLYIVDAAAFHVHIVINRQALIKISEPGFLFGRLQNSGNGTCGYPVGGREAAAIGQVHAVGINAALAPKIMQRFHTVSGGYRFTRFVSDSF